MTNHPSEAFGLMPVVEALLFEFCLRELKQRTLANRPARRLSARTWLHPAERVRVHLALATAEQILAASAPPLATIKQFRSRWPRQPGIHAGDTRVARE